MLVSKSGWNQTNNWRTTRRLSVGLNAWAIRKLMIGPIWQLPKPCKLNSGPRIDAWNSPPDEPVPAGCIRSWMIKYATLSGSKKDNGWSDQEEIALYITELGIKIWDRRLFQGVI